MPALLVTLGAVACSFDATGLGEVDTDHGLATGDAGDGSTSSASSGATTDGDTTGDSGGSGGDSATTGSTSSSTSGTSLTTTTTTGGSGTTTGTSTGMEATTEPPCDEPQTFYPDVDDDSFGDPEGGIEACVVPDGFVDNADDCDDGDANVHPGADEVCNGVDDDCDQAVDEYALTNSDSCGNCSPLVNGDRVYYFCTDGDDWVGARGKCLKRGADLASLDSSEHEFVWGKLKSLDGEFWIGANDRDNEGVYVWTDGSSLSVNDPRWAQDEPVGDGIILKVDCVTMGGWNAPSPGLYRMVACEPVFDRRWICEGPL